MNIFILLLPTQSSDSLLSWNELYIKSQYILEIEGQTAGRRANLLLPKYDSDFVKLHIAVYAIH